VAAVGARKIDMTRLGCFLAVVASLFLGTALAQTQPQWSVYQPAGGGFSVELPVDPDFKSEQISTDSGPARQTSAQILTGGLDCLVRFVEYQVDADAQTRFDRTRANFAGNASIRQNTALTIGDAPASRIVFDLADGDTATSLSVAIGKNRMIQIVCVAPKSQEASAAMARIYRSLTLVK
jgi:hypothetical protein